MVTDAPVTEPYWAVEANCLEQAGKLFGVSTKYLGAPENITTAAPEVKLMRAAVAQRPDGILIQDIYPKSLDPYIKQAVDQGIPVVMINGVGDVKGTGALTGIASDEYKSGLAAGQRLKAHGVKHAMIINAPPGAVPVLDGRTRGFIAGVGGRVTQVNIPTNKFTDSTYIKNAIHATLIKESSIDGVWSAGDIFSPAALVAQSAIGARAKSIVWGGNDVITQAVDAVKTGKWDFIVDQQECSHPYLGLVTLLLYKLYGIKPATDFIPTGPGLVTRENADEVAKLVKQHVR